MQGRGDVATCLVMMVICIGTHDLKSCLEKPDYYLLMFERDWKKWPGCASGQVDICQLNTIIFMVSCLHHVFCTSMLPKIAGSLATNMRVTCAVQPVALSPGVTGRMF